ncbi:MAG TPA: ABC transporter permease [Gemmatimonadales bacterium]|jgi:putative ABC transport system permease protein
MLGSLRQDLRYAVRQLFRSPGFTAVAVLTLSLGIGANTAIFSVVNAVLLRPLPYPEPSSLVKVEERRPNGAPNTVSYPNFLDWRTDGALGSIALYRPLAFNVGGADRPERVAGALVSADYFRVLGLTPTAGRYFLEGEDAPGRDGVAVISHGLWQRRFGGAPSALGRTLMVDGRALTVVGVAPPGFRYPEDTELWTLVSQDEPELLETRGLHAYLVIGRLGAGGTLEHVSARLQAVAARLAAEYPASNRGWGVAVVPLHESLVHDLRPTLLVLLGAVGFVLLIASANVAGMMLARGAARRRELAIRAALGAGRWQLVRQLFTETALLTVLGGMLGVGLAVWGVDALLSLAPEGLRPTEAPVMDGTVLAFTFGIAALTSMVFGLLPALQTARRGNEASLQETGRTTAGVDRQRTRRLLVAGEVALALLLLVGAGLMVQSFRRLLAVDPGFRTASVVSARLALPRTGRDTAEVIGFYRDLVDRARALPGVSEAAAVSYLPLSREGARYSFSVEGQPFAEPQQRPSSSFNVVTPGYFSALDIPLLQGRDFTEQDGWDSPYVAVVNQTLARRFWPNQSAVGKRLTFDDEPDEPGDWLTVIGVVGDSRHLTLVDDVMPQIYAPEAQVGLEEMALLVRTPLDPQTVAPAIRELVASLDPEVPVSEIYQLTRLRDESISTDRFRTLLLGGFGALALGLAIIGVYGVISYGVVQRTREIGIRVALGARRAEILRLVIGEGLLTVAGGIAAGLVAGAALSRLLVTLLFQVKPWDPATFASIAVVIAGVALGACVLPARRALRVDPASTLRAE